MNVAFTVDITAIAQATINFKMEKEKRL